MPALCLGLAPLAVLSFVPVRRNGEGPAFSIAETMVWLSALAAVLVWAVERVASWRLGWQAALAVGLLSAALHPLLWRRWTRKGSAPRADP
jgi:hypothetical protein